MKRQAVSMAGCVRCVIEYACYDSIHVLVRERKCGTRPERVRGRRVQWQVRDSELTRRDLLLGGRQP